MQFSFIRIAENSTFVDKKLIWVRFLPKNHRKFSSGGGGHTLSRVTHNSRFQLMCKKQAHFKKRKKIMCNVQVHTKHEILTHVQISVYHFGSNLGHVHVF